MLYVLALSTWSSNFLTSLCTMQRSPTDDAIVRRSHKMLAIRRLRCALVVMERIRCKRLSA